jgi:hypothetical protein
MEGRGVQRPLELQLTPLQAAGHPAEPAEPASSGVVPRSVYQPRAYCTRSIYCTRLEGHLITRLDRAGILSASCEMLCLPLL